MDTRVLTLFDDDDFFPKEEPKKKLKKEAPVKETASNETAQIFPDQEQREPVIIPEEIVAPDEAQTDTTPDTKEEPSTEVLTPLAEGSGSENEVLDEPKNEAPELVIEEEPQERDPIEEGYDEEVVLNINDKETENGETKQAAIAAADDELNRQILSELIQVDYTSLIHRDYPFDLQTAAVVAKSKTAAEQEPVAEQENEEDDEQEEEVFEDIVPLPEWKLDKKYYTIGEVAQLFSVNTSHIRFWTNEFKLKPRTTRKGDRLYSPKDIAELRLIHHLVKEKKHTIKGAKEKLKADKNDVNNKLDLKDSLINLRDTLLQIKAQL